MSITSEKDETATAMDRMYRYQTAIYDFTRKPYLLGRDTLLRALAASAQSHVLELACGTGRNLIEAARLYPSARFFGFDVSAVMIAKARTSVSNKGLGETITLAEGDATRFDSTAIFQHSQFDRVFISYALSMIPPWREALQHALILTKQQGTLSIVDFGSADDQPPWIRPFLLAWLKLFGVTPQPDLPSEARRLADAHHRPIEVRKLWGGYALMIVIGPVH